LTGETVAVKITTLEAYDVDQVEAIQREIELQKNLLHENIAQIYEVIKKENKIYIFMEYCKNGELFDKINKTGPMPEK
jgi:serine/threonine protein kinase